jgi:hypothetical protein
MQLRAQIDLAASATEQARSRTESLEIALHLAEARVESAHSDAAHAREQHALALEEQSQQAESKAAALYREKLGESDEKLESALKENCQVRRRNVYAKDSPYH